MAWVWWTYELRQSVISCNAKVSSIMAGCHCRCVHHYEIKIDGHRSKLFLRSIWKKNKPRTSRYLPFSALITAWRNYFSQVRKEIDCLTVNKNCWKHFFFSLENGNHDYIEMYWSLGLGWHMRCVLSSAHSLFPQSRLIERLLI